MEVVLSVHPLMYPHCIIYACWVNDGRGKPAENQCQGVIYSLNLINMLAFKIVMYATVATVSQ